MRTRKKKVLLRKLRKQWGVPANKLFCPVRGGLLQPCVLCECFMFSEGCWLCKKEILSLFDNNTFKGTSVFPCLNMIFGGECRKDLPHLHTDNIIRFRDVLIKEIDILLEKKSLCQG